MNNDDAEPYELGFVLLLAAVAVLGLVLLLPWHDIAVWAGGLLVILGAGS